MGDAKRTSYQVTDNQLRGSKGHLFIKDGPKWIEHCITISPPPLTSKQRELHSPALLPSCFDT